MPKEEDIIEYSKMSSKVFDQEALLLIIAVVL